MLQFLIQPSSWMIWILNNKYLNQINCVCTVELRFWALSSFYPLLEFQGSSMLESKHCIQISDSSNFSALFEFSFYECNVFIYLVLSPANLFSLVIVYRHCFHSSLFRQYIGFMYTQYLKKNSKYILYKKKKDLNVNYS